MKTKAKAMRLTGLASVFLAGLSGGVLDGQAQQDVQYPRNFDAKFETSKTRTANNSLQSTVTVAQFQSFGFKDNCKWLHVRDGLFSSVCRHHKRHSQGAGGAVIVDGWIKISGQLSDNQLNGKMSARYHSAFVGNGYYQDGVYAKGVQEGVVTGQLFADGTLKVRIDYKVDHYNHAKFKKVGDNQAVRTGEWERFDINSESRVVATNTVYRFDPKLAKKIDPSVTADTIRQEIGKIDQDAPNAELATGQPDSAQQPRKSVTLSGGNGTIALEDALKNQGIDGNTADTPTDQPIDKFDGWKRDFQDRGWRYVEKNGFAEFEPQEGARDKNGWVYSEDAGKFLRPPASDDQNAWVDQPNNEDFGQDVYDEQTKPHEPHRPEDGDENEQGNVWSDEDGGWIGRNLYEQEKERRANIKRLNEQTTSQDEDVKTLHDAWQRSKLERKIQPIIMEYVATEKKKLDGNLEDQIALETDLDRIRFLRDLQDQLNDLDVTDAEGVLGDWERIVNVQTNNTYQVDYTMKQFIAETGAMTLDTILTRGAAMATLHSYTAAVKEAGKTDATTGSILWEGTKEGVYQGTVGFVLNKLAVGAFNKAKAVRNAAKAAKAADDAAAAAAKAGKVQGNWNSSSQAIKEETQKKLLAKLPANHPARQIGKLNETLGKAGKQFDARKINPHMRLNPESDVYKAGIEALKKNPRYLTEQAKKATDAVRHDLDLAARERAVQELYKKHPDLKGHLTHFENTGSHARKGMNYRNGASDIDFTPKGTSTPQGKEAERLFSQYYDKAVEKVSNGKLTVDDLKAHAYGGDKGTGAFRSDLGLKVKDSMNQASGRIDKLDATGKITHSLRGSDPVEIGKPTRFFNKGAGQQIAKRDIDAFRKDLINKFTEELPEMGTQQEKLIQAAKGYKLSRVIEAKAVGGRPLSANRALYQWSKQIKNRMGTMNDVQMKAMTEKFLKGIENAK